MSRSARAAIGAAGIALLAAACSVAAQSAAGDEREALRAERAAIEQRHRAAEIECRQRFVVSGCLRDAQEQRRAALATLREREIALGERQRREQAAAQQQRLQDK
ncbi:MAG: hypothetical protein KIT28_14510, partial [Rubrivivax sp.]|nr:hypothetical protein [Rubrivivax sp.]